MDQCFELGDVSTNVIKFLVADLRHSRTITLDVRLRSGEEGCWQGVGVYVASDPSRPIQPPI